MQGTEAGDNAIKERVKKNDIAFAVGMVQADEDKTCCAWGVRSLPWLILTDRKHIVRAEGFGLQEIEETLEQSDDN